MALEVIAGQSAVTETRSSAGLEPTSDVSLVIGGMTCGACAARIEYRLNKLDGVTASVNYATERARATVARSVSPDSLVETVESIGYSAQVVTELEPVADQPGAIERRAKLLGRRLLVAALLFMPLCDFSLVFWLIPVTRFPGWQWVLLAFASPVVTFAAWPFYGAALRGARHGTYTMDTLVSLGIVAATSWSLYSMFFRSSSRFEHSIGFLFSHQANGASYLDVAAGVTTFALAGRYFEARTKLRTGSALRSLVAIGAKDVVVLDEHRKESRRPVSELVVGDRFVVRPGEAVATDGEVLVGRSAIDRSAMTGESIAVDVGPGDSVLGGTIVAEGRLVLRATRVGRDTQLAQMIRLVEEAQNEKADVQRLADRVSGIFVPAVIASALLALAGWLASGGGAERAINAALSVLIVACPCALGLATPMALLVAAGEGARRGIFFKGYQGLETSRRIDTVVLDKTGTVTSGEMSVADVESAPGVERSALLAWAGALEQASEHLVARAIVAAALESVGELALVDDFVAMPGLGVQGLVAGHVIRVGKPELFAESFDNQPSGLLARCAAWETRGRTAVLVGRDDRIVGAIAVADSIRPSAAPAVRELQALGLRCILLTGDNAATARAVGEVVGIAEVVAGALPTEKVALVNRLQDEGRSVAMVGDGVNDGPALARADLGLAIGSGTDVAINAADLIVVRDDLRAIATAITLARRTVATIRGNLAWAFVYNLAALPLAGCGILNPLIAAAVMALSSAFVVWNSARLRHFSTAREMPRPTPVPELNRSIA